MEHTIDWENLILPIDPADIPLVPSGDYPESATIIDKAAHCAATLVLQSALDATGARFTQEQWPNRKKDLENEVIDITGGQVTLGLKSNSDLTDDLDWDQLVMAAVMPIEIALLGRLRRDYPRRTP